MANKPPIAPQKMFLDPTTLYFPPPLSTRSISNSVTVYNRSEVQCVFKVHSAEPELYVVKPSSGILKAKSAMRVTVTLRKMSSEPTDVAEFGKKQRFKVRGKVIPAPLAAKVTDSSHASEIWKQCGDSIPLEMDTTLNCNFSGEVPNGADVSFDANAEVISPVSKEDPYVTAKRTAAAAAAAKNVTFGEGSTANGGGTIKSSLKGGEAITPKNANDLVNAESAGIKANTTTKQALAGAVGDFRDQKSQLEKEIKDRQSLLANLKASTLPASPTKSGTAKKSKVPKMSLAMALIMIIIFYVAGSVARVKIGGENVGRYVETYVPSEVRSVISTSRMALDDAVAPVVKRVSDQYAAVTGVKSGSEEQQAGSSETSTTVKSNAAADPLPIVEEKKEPTVVALQPEPPLEAEAKVNSETVSNSASQDKPQDDASASGQQQQQAKKRRKKKVKKD